MRDRLTPDAGPYAADGKTRFYYKDARDIFREVAASMPLDPQRAENFAARCVELLKGIAETRNVIRLSASSNGVH